MLLTWISLLIFIEICIKIIGMNNFEIYVLVLVQLTREALESALPKSLEGILTLYLYTEI